MKEQWMEKNGFANEFYIVKGGNTYPIKNQLKESGFRYSKQIGWYNKEEKQVPAGYNLQKVHFDDLYSWEEKYNKAFPYENIKKLF